MGMMRPPAIAVRAVTYSEPSYLKVLQILGAKEEGIYTAEFKEHDHGG